MLSVTTPMNLPGAAVSTPIARILNIRGFTTAPFPSVASVLLAARRHEMGGGRTRVHDPHAALLGIIGQPEGLLGGARNGYRGVMPSVFLVGSHPVNPY